VIDDCAVERLRCRSKAARRKAIACARPRIAAWMIMGKEDAGTSMLDGIDDDFPDRKVRSAFVARVAGDVEASRLVVDVRYPEALEARVVFGKAAREKITCGREAIEFQWKFGRLVPHNC
jgi:hypothetical protein